jgi:hypothetical protein
MGAKSLGVSARSTSAARGGRTLGGEVVEVRAWGTKKESGSSLSSSMSLPGELHVVVRLIDGGVTGPI